MSAKEKPLPFPGLGRFTPRRRRPGGLRTGRESRPMTERSLRHSSWRRIGGPRAGRRENNRNRRPGAFFTRTRRTASASSRAPGPQVFIAYVKEDEDEAGLLCDALHAAGFSPWIGHAQALPGQNWPRAIETAIETSDFFVPCFSHRSVSKWGGFQAEVRYALDCARRMPLDEIFSCPCGWTSAACRVHSTGMAICRSVSRLAAVAFDCLVSMMRGRGK